MKRAMLFVLAAGVAIGGLISVTAGDQAPPKTAFTVHAVGWIRKAEGKTTIVLDETWQRCRN